MTETIEDLHRPMTDPAIQRLNHLYGTAHERDQARFILGLLTIIRLSNGSQRSRKDLTAPYTKTGKEGKAVKKEAMAKEWHRQFVDHLIQQGFVQQVNQSRNISFQAVDQKAQKDLFDMVEDALFEDGQQLKKLLWPSDHLDLTEALQEEHEAETKGDDPPPVDEGLDAVKEVASQLKLVADHLGQVYQGLTTLDKRLDEKLTDLETRLGHLSGLEKRIETSFNRIIEAIEKDERVQLSVLADKMIEIGSRRTSLSNQLESEGRRLDKTLEEIKTLTAKTSKS